MKKIIYFVIVVLLLSVMTVTVSAAGGITLTNGVGKAGETVHISVYLDAPVTTDQMAVAYSYDESILRILPEQCTWQNDGVIKDFDDVRPYGAWAANTPKELSAQVCTLVFQVLPGTSFDSTQVSCTLTVMKEGKTLGQYSTTAQVRTTCNHTYGLWTSRDTISHTRSCSFCGDVEVKTHTWNEGQQIRDPQNSANSLLVHTCTVCGGTKSFVMEGVVTEQTDPQPTQPQQTQPVVIPQEPTDSSSQPSNPQSGFPTVDSDNHTGSTPATDPFTHQPVEDPDHVHTQPTLDDHDYNAAPDDHDHSSDAQLGAIENEAHDHDHDHETVQTVDPVDTAATPWVIAVVVAVLVGGLVFFVKKKW